MEKEKVYEELQKFHTRQLLTMLNSERHVDLYGEHEYDGYTKEDLKHVLATREHIPNKQEARVIRQQRAKQRK